MLVLETRLQHDSIQASRYVITLTNSANYRLLEQAGVAFFKKKNLFSARGPFPMEDTLDRSVLRPIWLLSETFPAL